MRQRRLTFCAKQTALESVPRHGQWIANVRGFFSINPANDDILMADYPNGTIRRLFSTPTQSRLCRRHLQKLACSKISSNRPPRKGLSYVNVPFCQTMPSSAGGFLASHELFVGFNSTDSWTFPPGTVWIKHFELNSPMACVVCAAAGDAAARCGSNDVYGVTYRWDETGTNALYPDASQEPILITDNGVVRTQVWIPQPQRMSSVPYARRRIRPRLQHRPLNRERLQRDEPEPNPGVATPLLAGHN
jgi:hypothetical protein